MTTTQPAVVGGSLQAVAAQFQRGGQRTTTYDTISAGFRRQRDDLVEVVICLCIPRPQLLEFTVGGTAFVSDAGAPAGWAEPTKPNTEPIEVDLWSAQIKEGAVVSYYRWNCTCDGLRWGGTDFEGQNASVFTLVGPVQPGSINFHVESHLPNYTYSEEPA